MRGYFSLPRAVVLYYTTTKTGMANSQERADSLNLGSHTRRVPSLSSEAQTWFDRGLNQLYGYNHEDAVYCFEKVKALERHCIFAYWAIALALGPNYNNPAGLGIERAIRELGEASTLIEQQHGSKVEAALVEALQLFYDDKKAEHLNKMETIFKENESDPDLRSFYAEAMMTRKPWKLWEPDDAGQIGKMNRPLTSITFL